MIENEISSKELAEYLDISVKTVYKYLNNTRRPSPEIEEQIRKYIFDVAQNKKRRKENQKKSFNIVSENSKVDEFSFQEFRKYFLTLDHKAQVHIYINIETLGMINRESLYFLLKTAVLYGDYPTVSKLLQDLLFYLARHRDIEELFLSEDEQRVLRGYEQFANELDDDNFEISMEELEIKFQKFTTLQRFYAVQYIAASNMFNQTIWTHLKLFFLLGTGAKKKEINIYNGTISSKERECDNRITLNVGRLSLSSAQLQIVNFIEGLFLPYYKERGMK